jgi:hypothetical protein
MTPSVNSASQRCLNAQNESANDSRPSEVARCLDWAQEDCEDLE